MSKDKLVKIHFPAAEIFRLEGEKNRSKGKKIADEFLFALADTPGIFETFDFIKNFNKRFYLVYNGDRTYLSVISGETLEYEPIDEEIIDNEFDYKGWHFKNKGRMK